MTTMPTSQSTNFILEGTSYFRIRRAAEILGCAAEDLLHLGASYKVQITSPVLMEGTYAWAINPASAGYPEISGDVTCHFDSADRVLLSSTDVAKIEAIGWAIPTRVYAPLRAQEIDELLQSAYKEDEKEPDSVMAITRTENGLDLLSFSYLPAQIPDLTDDAVLTSRKRQYYAPWYLAEDPPAQFERTTIDCLFISKEEVFRLQAGQQATAPERLGSSATEKIHGNYENNSATREQVLKAAIYVRENFPNECCKKGRLSRTAWARLIDEKAPLFWKIDARPPLAQETIIRLLSNALRDPDHTVNLPPGK